ncbi:hypothetical protein LLH00_13825 [bacterium]|nr:hypothetical protein [bacterium]
MNVGWSDFEAVQWREGIPGVRFKILQHAGWRVRLVEFAAGFREPDWCLRGHSGYVLSGNAVLEMDGGQLGLAPGQAFILPQGEENRHIIQVGGQPIQLLLVELD